MFYKNPDTEFWSMNDDKISNEQLGMRDESYYVETPVKLKGALSKLMFPKAPNEMEEYGYAIIKVKTEEILEGELHPKARDYMGCISVKGNMQNLTFGETHEFTIILDEVDEKWGASYKINFIRSDFNFENEEQIKIFFTSFLSENQIDNLYKQFDKPLKILQDGDIESLKKVKGIGESTAMKILDKYESSLDYAQAYVELSKYNLTNDAIKKLCDKYGSPEVLVGVIRNNPYKLIEVDGYGFKKADNIASNMGMEKDDIKRVIAFIDYVLNEMGNSGYSWIDSRHLVSLIEENLGYDVNMDTVLEAVNTLKQLGTVWNEERGKIGAMKFYKLELNIVKELIRLKNGSVSIPDNWEVRVKQAEILQGYDYTEEQKNAIESVIKNPVSIIIGKAGTGKTTSVLGAIKALGGDLIISQCALSGKASARLKEVTGKDSYTIHKLLGYDPRSEGESNFVYNKDNQLPSDVVILDESSMVGGDAFFWLIQSIQTGSRFVMIGDVRQLSSIGALNVFYDVVNSGVIPLSEITKIHRQGEKSAIITESHKISDGIQLFEKDFEGVKVLGELQDLILDITKNRHSIPDKVLEYFIQEIAIVKDVLEVQVISPLNTRGHTSVYSFNKIIQEWYNPENESKAELFHTSKGEKSSDGYTFREGDKIMVVVNNYRLVDTKDNKTTLFNGYTGIITKIVDKNIIASFPLADTENEVILPVEFWSGKRGVVLGYASTTAKNQGSGYDSVVYAIDNSHYMLLCKEQLYTAITRAKKKMTLVGESIAIINAIKTNETSDKQTFMPLLLKGEINERL